MQAEYDQLHSAPNSLNKDTDDQLLRHAGDTSQCDGKPKFQGSCYCGVTLVLKKNAFHHPLPWRQPWWPLLDDEPEYHPP